MAFGKVSSNGVGQLAAVQVALAAKKAKIRIPILLIAAPFLTSKPGRSQAHSAALFLPFAACSIACFWIVAIAAPIAAPIYFSECTVASL